MSSVRMYAGIMAGLLALLVVASCSDSSSDGGTWSSYDTFSVSNIDVTKWNSGTHTAAVVGGALQMTTSAANLAANQSITDTLTALLPAPTSIQADVNLSAATLAGDGQARAVIELAYQPDAYWSISSQDHFYARVELRYRNGSIDVRPGVGGCANADCSQTYDVTNGFYPILTGQSLGTTHRVKVEYASPAFTVTVYDTSGVVQGTPAVLDMSSFGTFNAANIKTARLRSRVIGPSTSSGTSASMTVTFANVLINGTAYDTLAAGPIDTLLWESGERSRTLSSGLVQFDQTQANQSYANSLEFPGANAIQGIAADVAVTSSTASGTGAFYRARLGGVFYNDGTVATGRETGSAVSDIYSEISMDGTNVYYLVERCTDVTCSTSDNLSGTSSDSRITLVGGYSASVHNLSILWDGTQFAYKVDGTELATFIPADFGAPVAQATSNDGWKVIGTRASDTDSGLASGSISATIDNVEVYR